MKKMNDIRIPDLMTMKNGEKCDSVEQWESIRRPEILEDVTRILYGRYPGMPTKIDYLVIEHDSQAYGGIAIKETIRAVCYGPEGTFTFPLFLARPKNLTVCGAIVHVEGRPMTDEERQQYLPAGHPVTHHVEEKIVTSGFASISYHSQDLDPETGWKDSILSIFPEDTAPDACRVIGAWSMGGLIAMDYMATHEGYDLSRTAIVGCSRRGKTALWVGVNEPRYQLVGLVESGHGGAAMARVTDGERCANMSQAFQWTCENYKAFAGRDEELPYDAHMLLSLIAPRALYVCSARDDYWCDPDAEFLSVKLTEEVYQLYGLQGIALTEPPKDELPDQGGRIGYHLRDGSHGFSDYDWQCFLAFARKQFG